MRFTDLFIQRPVLAVVLSALIVIAGLASLDKITLREFPELERSVISVTTVYPGANSRTIQGFVTTPLQVNIAGARGVEYISSSSNPGVSAIEVHVRLGENTSDVLTEVIAKVNEARDELPDDVLDPVISTASSGDAMMYMAFVSDQMTPFQVTDYLLRSVQPELATIEGVGKAGIFGRYLAMRIWLDPVRMAALNVTANDVNAAIRRDNVISTAGATEGEWVRVTVDAVTGMRTAEEFQALVVRQDKDRQVRLGDIADVELAAENNQSRQSTSGRDTVFMSITTAPDANPLSVSAAVHALLPAIEANLPADLELILDWDSSVAIDDALQEVINTLLEAGVIVILVIFLFLGSLRVVLIPLVAIPLSLIGVVFIMLSMGFSLNLLTLLAMVIAIGLVVDDAIVVVENVHRHIEDGATPMQAAIDGAREVALPVIAMTVTLAAVYAPIAFIGGLTGALFSEFALTLAGAVLVSGVVALTLSPMMASRFLQAQGDQGRFADALDNFFHGMNRGYQRLLEHCLANRGAVLMFAGGILLSLPALFLISQRELAPEEDTGSLYVVGSAPSYANLDYVSVFLDQVVDIWKDIPEIQSSWQVAQPDSNFGGLNMTPWRERSRTQQEVQRELQAKLGGVSGMEMFSFGNPALPGSDSGLPLSFVVASTADYAEVERVGDELLSAARESGLFIFVNQSLDFNRPEISVNINRELAARLGISMQDIANTLAVMLGEAEVNRFTREGRSYKVIPQAGRNFRLTQSELEKYYLRTTGGDLVPLSSVISLETRVEPNTLSQYQQLNSTTLQGMMMPPNTLGDGLAFLETTLQEIAPRGFRVGYTGASRRYVQESATFPILFAMSLVLIFLVLAAQFNSFRDPLVVLVAVPLSVFGAMLPIAMGVMTLNIYTQVGLLTLIGLIAKHGILIVEFANQLVQGGADRRSAVLQSATLRLRPILMTTFATVLGVLPLVLAAGPGANARFGIGLTITAGMLIGTLFTLFVLPVMYLPFRREKAPAQTGEEALASPTAST
ncbi:efflux RND transporter permease subunit [Congregibacter sp.]|uniref:efflux RND transporter permease subunit n=1 Tax=Congregibacter sp. TaxID=2744308 RepID=UPI003F6CFD82